MHVENSHSARARRATRHARVRRYDVRLTGAVSVRTRLTEKVDDDARAWPSARFDTEDASGIRADQMSA